MALRWVLILLQFAWFNVLMPGHVRGQITMPPSSTDQGCCQADEDHDRSSPDSDQRQRCAVCYFARTLTPPPPIVFWQPCVGLIRVVAVIASPTPVCISIDIPYLGRAPPGHAEESAMYF